MAGSIETLNKKILHKALRIGSEALATGDPADLSRISAALSLLSIASSSNTKEAERLIRIAERISLKEMGE
jgi:hypothetical protein